MKYYEVIYKWNKITGYISNIDYSYNLMLQTLVIHIIYCFWKYFMCCVYDNMGNSYKKMNVLIILHLQQ